MTRIKKLACSALAAMIMMTAGPAPAAAQLPENDTEALRKAGDIIHIVLRWQPRDRWDFNFGYRDLSRRISTADLYNRFGFDNLIFSIGYSFGE